MFSLFERSYKFIVGEKKRFHKMKFPDTGDRKYHFNWPMKRSKAIQL